MFRVCLISFLLITTNAHSETVLTKYHGEISLENYACPEIKPSSFVNRICFDKSSKDLIVQLRNTYYRYCKITEDVFTSWISAPSLGRYYNRYVKTSSSENKFSCTDLDD